MLRRTDEGPTGTEMVAGLASAAIAALRNPRYEVFPSAGIEEQVRAHVAPDVKLTVTASPSRGLEPTLALAERLANSYGVVPHIAARQVVDDSHLQAILSRLEGAGLKDVFVIAGDAPQPAGKFEGALALLESMDRLGHQLVDIGIAGYPESHPFIDDDVTIQAMWDKRRFATYIVSNVCFDAHTIVRWVKRVRKRGVELPIYVGMPGSTPVSKLVRISARIGVGESARFIKMHRNWMRLVVPGGYKPERLLTALEGVMSEEEANVRGLHIYTFNEVDRTERWRRALLDQAPA